VLSGCCNPSSLLDLKIHPQMEAEENATDKTCCHLHKQ
jgi:hypothetical protein